MMQTRSQPRDALHGAALLNDAIRNKGTAFTTEERRKFGLEGLPPPPVDSLDRPAERVMRHLNVKPTILNATSI
jgi:malate dehydrogenase (oxaloacetate-decarboxylating)(NADP+)